MRKFTKNEQNLFDVLIIHGDLTLPSLDSNGISYSTLLTMIKKGKLIRVKKGFFALPDYSLLLDYAEQLKEEGKLEKANKCIQVYEENCEQNIKRLVEIAIQVYNCTSLTNKHLLEAGLKIHEINLLYNRGILNTLGKYYVFNKKVLPEAPSNKRKNPKENVVSEISSNPSYLETELKQYLHMIYTLIGKGRILYKSTLEKQGIPVTELIMKHIFKKYCTQKGITLIEIDGLIEYANRCFLEGKVNETLNCYVYAMKIKMNVDYAEKIVALYILNGNINEAVKGVRHIENIPTKSPIYNTFIYLLSFLSDLKIYEINVTKKLNLADLIDVSTNSITFEKDFKQLLLSQKFKSALALLRAQNQEKKDIYLSSIDELLQRIILKRAELSQRIISYVEETKYRELLTLLEQENSYHRLSSTESIYFSIVKDIIEKIEEGMSPVVTTPQNDTLYELIRTKNYDQAYLKWIDLSVKKGKSSEKNCLGKLLKQASSLLSNTKTIVEIESKTEITLGNNNDNANNTYKRFFNYLRSGNKIGAIEIAEGVLRSNGLSEFSYFIRAMVEQSIVEKDPSYIRAVGTLRRLERGTFFIESSHKIIDVDILINDINTLLGENLFVSARHLMLVIKQVQEHGHSIYTDEEMRGIIDTLENKLNAREKKYKK